MNNEKDETEQNEEEIKYVPNISFVEEEFFILKEINKFITNPSGYFSKKKYEEISPEKINFIEESMKIIEKRDELEIDEGLCLIARELIFENNNYEKIFEKGKKLEDKNLENIFNTNNTIIYGSEIKNKELIIIEMILDGIKAYLLSPLYTFIGLNVTKTNQNKLYCLIILSDELNKNKTIKESQINGWKILEENIKFNQALLKNVIALILGETCTGKQNFLKAILNENFGNTLSLIDIVQQDIYLEKNGTLLKIIMWAMNSLKDNGKYLNLNTIKKSNMIVFIYRIDNLQTFNVVKENIGKICSVNPNNKLFLIGNCADKEKERQVFQKDVLPLIKEYKINYFNEISLLTRFNVEKVVSDFINEANSIIKKVCFIISNKKELEKQINYQLANKDIRLKLENKLEGKFENGDFIIYIYSFITANNKEEVVLEIEGNRQHKSEIMLEDKSINLIFNLKFNKAGVLFKNSPPQNFMETLNKKEHIKCYVKIPDLEINKYCFKLLNEQEEKIELQTYFDLLESALKILYIRLGIKWEKYEEIISMNISYTCLQEYDNIKTIIKLFDIEKININNELACTWITHIIKILYDLFTEEKLDDDSIIYNLFYIFLLYINKNISLENYIILNDDLCKYKNINNIILNIIIKNQARFSQISLYTENVLKYLINLGEIKENIKLKTYIFSDNFYKIYEIINSNFQKFCDNSFGFYFIKGKMDLEQHDKKVKIIVKLKKDGSDNRICSDDFFTNIIDGLKQIKERENKNDYWLTFFNYDFLEGILNIGYSYKNLNRLYLIKDLFILLFKNNDKEPLIIELNNKIHELGINSLNSGLLKNDELIKFIEKDKYFDFTKSGELDNYPLDKVTSNIDISYVKNIDAFKNTDFISLYKTNYKLFFVQLISKVNTFDDFWKIIQVINFNRYEFRGYIFNCLEQKLIFLLEQFENIDDKYINEFSEFVCILEKYNFSFTLIKIEDININIEKVYLKLLPSYKYLSEKLKDKIINYFNLEKTEGIINFLTKINDENTACFLFNYLSKFYSKNDEFNSPEKIVNEVFSNNKSDYFIILNKLNELNILRKYETVQSKNYSINLSHAQGLLAIKLKNMDINSSLVYLYFNNGRYVEKLTKKITILYEDNLIFNINEFFDKCKNKINVLEEQKNKAKKSFEMITNCFPNISIEQKELIRQFAFSTKDYNLYKENINYIKVMDIYNSIEDFEDYLLLYDSIIFKNLIGNFNEVDFNFLLNINGELQKEKINEDKIKEARNEFKKFSIILDEEFESKLSDFQKIVLANTFLLIPHDEAVKEIKIIYKYFSPILEEDYIDEKLLEIMNISKTFIYPKIIKNLLFFLENSKIFYQRQNLLVEDLELLRSIAYNNKKNIINELNDLMRRYNNKSFIFIINNERYLFHFYINLLYQNKENVESIFYLMQALEPFYNHIKDHIQCQIIENKFHLEILKNLTELWEVLPNSKIVSLESFISNLTGKKYIIENINFFIKNNKKIKELFFQVECAQNEINNKIFNILSEGSYTLYLDKINNKFSYLNKSSKKIINREEITIKELREISENVKIEKAIDLSKNNMIESGIINMTNKFKDFINYLDLYISTLNVIKDSNYYGNIKVDISISTFMNNFEEKVIFNDCKEKNYSFNEGLSHLKEIISLTDNTFTLNYTKNELLRYIKKSDFKELVTNISINNNTLLTSYINYITNNKNDLKILSLKNYIEEKFDPFTYVYKFVNNILGNILKDNKLSIETLLNQNKIRSDYTKGLKGIFLLEIEKGKNIETIIIEKCQQSKT